MPASACFSPATSSRKLQRSMISRLRRPMAALRSGEASTSRSAAARRVHIARRHDGAVLAGLHQIGAGADLVADHDRAARVHRLVDHEAPGLLPRGQDEDIGGVVEGGQLALIAESGEADALGDAAAPAARASSWPRKGPSPTRQRLASGLADAREGLQQHIGRLDGRQLAGEENARPVRGQAERGKEGRAAGGGGLGPGAEALIVDGIGHGIDLGRIEALLDPVLRG